MKYVLFLALIVLLFSACQTTEITQENTQANTEQNTDTTDMDKENTETEDQRWSRVLNLPLDGNLLYVPEYTEVDFLEFFDKSKECWKSKKEPGENEGIVLKHKDSKLVLNRKGSVKNMMWFKVKWRDGPAGTTLTEDFEVTVKNAA